MSATALPERGAQGKIVDCRGGVVCIQKSAGYGDAPEFEISSANGANLRIARDDHLTTGLARD